MFSQPDHQQSLNAPAHRHNHSLTQPGNDGHAKLTHTMSAETDRHLRDSTKPLENATSRVEKRTSNPHPLRFAQLPSSASRERARLLDRGEGQMKLPRSIFQMASKQLQCPSLLFCIRNNVRGMNKMRRNISNVTPAGFEPATKCLKGTCATAALRGQPANIVNQNHLFSSGNPHVAPALNPHYERSKQPSMEDTHRNCFEHKLSRKLPLSDEPEGLCGEW